MMKRKRRYYAGLPIAAAVICAVCWTRVEPVELLVRETLTVFGYVAAVSDWTEKRVPNMLLKCMLGAWVLILVPQLFFQPEKAVLRLLTSGLGLLIGGGIFLLVYLFSRGGLGGGDVKLMAVSGLYLGVQNVLPAMLYGSILASVVGCVLILMKKIGRKDAIPLVPFLYAGILLTMLFR